MRGPSIRLRLLAWLIVPFFIISVIGGVSTYWLAWVPVRDAYDLALANAAWSLTTRLREADYRRGIDLPLQAEQVVRADQFDEIFFAVQDRNGLFLTGDRGLPHRPIPLDLNRPVFYNGDYGGLPVRMASLPTRLGGELIVVTVAETTAKRQRARQKIITTLVAWEVALTLTIVALGWMITGMGLSPLGRLRAALAQRSPHDLAPLDEAQVPKEVQPLAAAINVLLNRVAEATRAQQNFIADVAHQLRTPLAGLLTQLAVARQQAPSVELREALLLMQRTADRTVRLANQLLALARAEPSGFHAERLRQVNLADSIRRNVDAWLRLADERQIDLSFEIDPVCVRGDEFLLRELFDNLVTNAIQYTPAGGRVIIGCAAREPGGAVVYVEDNGPGIPLADRKKVFERFYRIPGTSGDGSGLGLTIAREIARAHGGEILILTPAGHIGARVEVRFPAYVASAASG